MARRPVYLMLRSYVIMYILCLYPHFLIGSRPQSYQVLKIMLEGVCFVIIKVYWQQAILANTPNQTETLLHSLEQATTGIGLHVNVHKTEYMSFNQTGDISTLDGSSLKLVDKFTYLGSSVSSTEKDIDMWLTKAWTAIDKLSIIWKSDLTDKMKRSFFQTAVVSILLYGCTTWTLTKRLEKKPDGNYTSMLRAILNESWRQHPTKYQLYGHLPPSWKLSKWDEPDMEDMLEKQGRAHKWYTPMDPHIWLSKSRTASSSIHTAALWGYGM